MDSYKEINRELILGNQELKMQQNMFQEQIIYLKRQLMEEVERRVVSEKMIKIMLIDNFKNALKLLDPESSLLAVIQNVESSKMQEHHQEKQNQTRILEELRRSNSLHRRSSIVVSPTRRLTYTMQVEGENAVQDMSLEENLGLQSCDNLACIVEEKIPEEEVEKDVEAPNTTNTGTIVQDTLQSLQNMTVTEDMSITEIEEEESLAADSISQNFHDKEHFLEKSPPPQILLKNKQSNGCYLRRSPMQDVSNLENGVVENQNSAKIQEHNHANVVVRRGKRRSLFNNESIESVRHSQKKGGQDEIEVLTLSIGMNSFRGTSLETRAATSMALSEMTCGQFANAPSSTPNSSQFKNCKNSSEILETTQTRASRRCKPTCLAEPNLNSKMRNNDTKIQSTRKNTKKKNKN